MAHDLNVNMPKNIDGAAGPLVVIMERSMLRYTILLGMALTFAPALVVAQIDTNRIGVMSPTVVQQRLRLLGYTNVIVMDIARTAVQANAVKSGRTLVVRLDPHSGKVTEVLGRLERRPQGLRLIKPNGQDTAPPQ
jgi:hypothetical protein